jgi:hypothetical protein
MMPVWFVLKNNKIILEGKTTCRLHKRSPNEYIKIYYWTALGHSMTKHVGFPSKIILIILLVSTNIYERASSLQIVSLVSILYTKCEIVCPN